MTTFYLLITAGLIKIIAAIIVQGVKEPDKDHRKLIVIIKFINYFAIALILFAILLAVIK